MLKMEGHEKQEEQGVKVQNQHAYGKARESN
jgi:hypothetical protein